MNNNVLIFEPGHPFLIEYLHQMLISYDPKLYHANGPNLITKVYQIEKWFIPIIHKVSDRVVYTIFGHPPLLSDPINC